MGLPHPNSPNGCWQRHGYRSEVPADKPRGALRNIYAPGGALVLADADYDTQIAYCRDHGMLLPEAEVERMMQRECRAGTKRRRLQRMQGHEASPEAYLMANRDWYLPTSKA